MKTKLRKKFQENLFQYFENESFRKLLNFDVGDKNPLILESEFEDSNDSFEFGLISNGKDHYSFVLNHKGENNYQGKLIRNEKNGTINIQGETLDEAIEYLMPTIINNIFAKSQQFLGYASGRYSFITPHETKNFYFKDDKSPQNRKKIPDLREGCSLTLSPKLKMKYSGHFINPNWDEYKVEEIAHTINMNADKISQLYLQHNVLPNLKLSKFEKGFITTAYKMGQKK